MTAQGRRDTQQDAPRRKDDVKREQRSGVPVRRPGVQSGYDLWASSYDTTANPTVYLDRLHTLRALDAQPGEKVLDAGCGTGAHVVALRRQGVASVGVDFSRGMLGVAKQVDASVPLLVGDLHRPLPFADAVFDAVVCSLVSEHLEQLHVFFAEARRVLVSGGRFVFTAFHPELVGAGVEANFTRDAVEYRLGAEPHGVDDFMREMQLAGFGGIQVENVVGDEALVEALPAAKKYLGKSCLVLLTAKAP